MLPLTRLVLEGCCSIHLSYGRATLLMKNLMREGCRSTGTVAIRVG